MQNSNAWCLPFCWILDALLPLAPYLLKLLMAVIIVAAVLCGIALVLFVAPFVITFGPLLYGIVCILQWVGQCEHKLEGSKDEYKCAIIAVPALALWASANAALILYLFNKLKRRYPRLARYFGLD